MRLTGTLPASLVVLALLFATSRSCLAAGRSMHDSTQGDLAAAINLFGDKLFAQLAKETQPGHLPGLVISPYSIAQALAMLLNGAKPKGTSFGQLQALLGAGQVPLEKFNSQFQALTAALLPSSSAEGSQAGTGIRIQNANSAWLKKDHLWQPQYAKVLKTHFNATLRMLSSAQAVNSWVAQATNDKITQIVSDDVLASAILLLVNAVYFKGSWADVFPDADTKAATFHLLDGSTKQTAMMHQRIDQGQVQVATLPTTAGGAAVQCEAIKLPFVGYKFAGIVAQPKGNVSKQGGALALHTAAGRVDYPKALAACRSAVVNSLPGGAGSGAWASSRAPTLLYMPRFEMEFSTSLVRALQALGVRKPFLGGDLTQMAQDAQGNPMESLAVSAIVHKVYSRVDENGAEAAATTTTGIGSTWIPVVENPVELRFDRPFQFIVAHQPSGLALFNGEIYKPE